jgi:hypothetical protein
MPGSLSLPLPAPGRKRARRVHRQAAELEYEAALERRRREVEAERLRRELAADEAAGARACAAEAPSPPGEALYSLYSHALNPYPKLTLHPYACAAEGPCLVSS